MNQKKITQHNLKKIKIPTVFNKKFSLTSEYIQRMAYLNGAESSNNAEEVHAISDFRIGLTPVTWETFSEYAKYKNFKLNYPKYYFKNNHPAVNISAVECDGYCKWLSSEIDILFRLPTSEEFEYAASQGNKKNVYPWGERWDAGKVWCSIKPNKVISTAPVLRNNNIFFDKKGLSDMSGNVWQWCFNGIGEDRFFKGGSWDTYIVEYLKTSYVGSAWQEGIHTNFGFRIISSCK